MKKRIVKSGRIVVELDGYSEYYQAYVLGAITGAVSFPAKFKNQDDDILADMAKDCLYDKLNGTENTKYYNAKIIRRAGKIQ
jgi:galactose-1-phosphate uridylyltransferase